MEIKRRENPKWERVIFHFRTSQGESPCSLQHLQTVHCVMQCHKLGGNSNMRVGLPVKYYEILSPNQEKRQICTLSKVPPQLNHIQAGKKKKKKRMSPHRSDENVWNILSRNSCPTANFDTGKNELPSLHLDESQCVQYEHLKDKETLCPETVHKISMLFGLQRADDLQLNFSWQICEKFAPQDRPVNLIMSNIIQALYKQLLRLLICLQKWNQWAIWP